MFGYVVANSKELSQEHQRRYQAFYCGLCRALGQRCGKFSQLTLSYDMAFLAMLLTGLYELEGDSGNDRCVIHPTKRHDWVANSAMDYAADMSVLLAYYNFLDDWQDSHSPASKAAARALQHQKNKVSRKYPHQSAAIHHWLSQLERCERENCTDLDQVSGCFGNLMAALFAYRQDMWQSTLEEMATALGKFIYLMDAYEDLPKDLKRHEYNPWAAYRNRPDFEQHCHEVLTMLMAQSAAAFEKLPILQDQEILRNIIYSGVWTKYYLVSRRRQQRSHSK